MNGFQNYDQWKTASPYDADESPCEICGIDPAECKCPECPECGEHGNPACKINAGKTPANAHNLAIALMDELGTDSLYGVYRNVYKYTDCGPSVGFLLTWVEYNDNGESGPGGTCDERRSKWVYCDDLHTAPTLEALKAAEWDDVTVEAISISSIVEGVDQCTESVILDGMGLTPQSFWDGVTTVDTWANEIWMETHGCPDCYEYPEDELHPVDPECKTCEGHGECI